jgi:hypothetical protein
MKRLCLTVILGLFLVTPALGLTYLGTPTTVLKTGEWTVGASYTKSEQDLELSGGTDFDDLKEKSVLARVSVGLVDKRMEIFGLMGGADWEQDGTDMNGEFLVGLGTRITTNRGDGLDWGVVGQFTYFTREDHGLVDGVWTPFDLALFDIQIGMGPCWRPGQFTLYGGPMVHIVEGDLNTDAAGDFDVHQKSWFGAYLGGGVEFDKHLSLSGEAQGTGDAWALAASLAWRF